MRSRWARPPGRSRPITTHLPQSGGPDHRPARHRGAGHADLLAFGLGALLRYTADAVTTAIALLFVSGAMPAILPGSHGDGFSASEVQGPLRWRVPYGDTQLVGPILAAHGVTGFAGLGRSIRGDRSHRAGMKPVAVSTRRFGQ